MKPYVSVNFVSHDYGWSFTRSEYDAAFSNAIAFSLGQLGLPHLFLKEEQQSAIKAVYSGKDVFVCLQERLGRDKRPGRVLFLSM